MNNRCILDSDSVNNDAQFDVIQTLIDSCEYDKAYEMLASITGDSQKKEELIRLVEPFYGLTGKWEINYDSMTTSDGKSHIVPYRYLYIDSITMTRSSNNENIPTVYFRNIIQSGIGKVEYSKSDPWDKWFNTGFFTSGNSSLTNSDGVATFSTGSSNSDKSYPYKTCDISYEYKNGIIYAEFSFYKPFGAGYGSSKVDADIVVKCEYHKVNG